MNINTDYLNRLLVKYAGSFNLYLPYTIEGKTYAAYGFFSSHVEKYVLTKEANLWSSDGFEHILFVEEEFVTGEVIDHATHLIENHMESSMVRKGEKYPDKNHMYSYLTVILISNRPIENAIRKKVKRYSFDKGYKFNLRGYSQGRLAVVSLPDEKIYLNHAAKKLQKSLVETFQDLKQDKVSFSQLLSEGKVKPFTQE